MARPPIESPAAWLRPALERRGVSQGAIARLLGIDKSVCGRYARGDEQIPRPYLARLIQELDPGAYDYVLCLKDCEDFADAVRRSAARFALALQGDGAFGRRPNAPHRHDAPEAAGDGSLANRLADALFANARAILDQEPTVSPAGRARAWRRLLTDAVRATELVCQTVEAAYAVPLLPAATVPGFRFPLNHFVGRLLDLDELVSPGTPDAAAVVRFRDRVLGTLRGAVWDRHPPGGPMDILARQFSAHLLSRHGDEEDRDRVRASLLRGAADAAPLLRRLSYSGLVLGHRDAEAADRYLWDLTRDRSLAAVNLLFNAFHYGDVAFRGDRPPPSEVARFDRTVPHILRHLERPDLYRGILDTECVTLAHVLDAGGPRPFLRPGVRARLRTLLHADGEFLTRVRPATRTLFVDRFRPLLTAKG